MNRGDGDGGEVAQVVHASDTGFGLCRPVYRSLAVYATVVNVSPCEGFALTPTQPLQGDEADLLGVFVEVRRPHEFQRQELAHGERVHG